MIISDFFGERNFEHIEYILTQKLSALKHEITVGVGYFVISAIQNCTK